MMVEPIETCHGYEAIQAPYFYGPWLICHEAEEAMALWSNLEQILGCEYMERHISPHLPPRELVARLRIAESFLGDFTGNE
jgi:hypothetical protein